MREHVEPPEPPARPVKSSVAGSSDPVLGGSKAEGKRSAHKVLVDLASAATKHSEYYIPEGDVVFLVCSLCTALEDSGLTI